MYNLAKDKSDIVLIEVGGDILEGNADIFLKISQEKKFNNILVVNDAMGGRYGITLFENINLSIFTWRQNSYSLKCRLEKEEVYTFLSEDIYRYIKGKLKNIESN